MLFGWQMGASPAGEVDRKIYGNRSTQHSLMYLHDGESWKKMWAEVEAQTGTKWDVQAVAVETPEVSERMGARVPDKTLHSIHFSMTRL